MGHQVLDGPAITPPCAPIRLGKGHVVCLIHLSLPSRVPSSSPTPSPTFQPPWQKRASVSLLRPLTGTLRHDIAINMLHLVRPCKNHAALRLAHLLQGGAMFVPH